MYGSLQSVGHTMDYFVRHTRKLVLFIVMPRVNNTRNLLRVYKEGALVEERLVPSSQNIVWYYLLWWWYHNYFLLTYLRSREQSIVFVSHPVACFGMNVIKFLRRVTYAYWVGDYYPPVRWSLVAFEKLKKYYHDRIGITYYLSDTINAMFNGRVIRQANKRTVMWGVKPPSGVKKVSKGAVLGLLFVGVVRQSQGLEDIFSYLADHRDVRLRIVGVCDHRLYGTYTRMIEELGISDRVAFPNTFIDDKDLGKLAMEYHVGVALYEKGLTSSTHYTDPGKVKTYVELGMPVIMTNISAIAPYIQKFNAGEVIEETWQLPTAVEKVKQRYDVYQRGLLAFAQYFAYERYYKQAFVAFEKAG